MSYCGRKRSVSNWGYIALAYTVVWGSLAVYAIVLARRVAQASRVAAALRQSLSEGGSPVERDGTSCDAPPVP